MEKFGVLEDDSTKTASDKEKCPVCNSKLKDPELTGGLLVCPQCGTAPFEAK